MEKNRGDTPSATLIENMNIPLHKKTEKDRVGKNI